MAVKEENKMKNKESMDRSLVFQVRTIVRLRIAGESFFHLLHS